MTQWEPCPGWLVVEAIETEEMLGSLVIPEKSRERIAGWTYTVVSVGKPLVLEEDEERTEHDFQPGDWVLTPPRRAYDVDEERLLLLARDSVWAVIR